MPAYFKIMRVWYSRKNRPSRKVYLGRIFMAIRFPGSKNDFYTSIRLSTLRMCPQESEKE